MLAALNDARVEHRVYDPQVRYTGALGEDDRLLDSPGAAGVVLQESRLTERSIERCLLTAARMSRLTRPPPTRWRTRAASRHSCAGEVGPGVADRLSAARLSPDRLAVRRRPSLGTSQIVNASDELQRRRPRNGRVPPRPLPASWRRLRDGGCKRRSVSPLHASASGAAVAREAIPIGDQLCVPGGLRVRATARSQSRESPTARVVSTPSWPLARARWRRTRRSRARVSRRAARISMARPLGDWSSSCAPRRTMSRAWPAMPGGGFRTSVTCSLIPVAFRPVLGVPPPAPRARRTCGARGAARGRPPREPLPSPTPRGSRRRFGSLRQRRTPAAARSRRARGRVRRR